MNSESFDVLILSPLGPDGKLDVNAWLDTLSGDRMDMAMERTARSLGWIPNDEGDGEKEFIAELAKQLRAMASRDLAQGLVEHGMMDAQVEESTGEFVYTVNQDFLATLPADERKAFYGMRQSEQLIALVQYLKARRMAENG